MSGVFGSNALGEPFAFKALYIHIPFCASRCSYCDFATEAVSRDDPRIDDYVESLVKAVRSAARDGLLNEVQTIYIGGGTPTHIGSKRLVNLVYTLSVSIGLGSCSEFSVEANPESLTAAMLRDLYALGVNRLSIGVQSFNDNELQALGRAHSAADAKRAASMAQERFENISLDLMCGIPGQSQTSWQRSLGTAVGLGPKHVSVYPLTLEDGTPLAQAVLEGRQSVADDDAQSDLMLLGRDILEQSGFKRYEIASWAQPGFECRHNIAYWSGIPYLGIGKSAAGMANTATGRERMLEGNVVEELSMKERTLEDIMLAMRMASGASIAQLDSLGEEDCLATRARALFSQMEEAGLVQLADAAYSLTDRGWLLGNAVFGRIWDLRSKACQR